MELETGLSTLPQVYALLLYTQAGHNRRKSLARKVLVHFPVKILNLDPQKMIKDWATQWEMDGRQL